MGWHYDICIVVFYVDFKIKNGIEWTVPNPLAQTRLIKFPLDECNWVNIFSR